MAATDTFPLVQGCFGLFAVCLLVSLVRFSLLSLRPKHYPPGPPALPFIGNVHHFASNKPYLQFTDLRKKYGDIVGLKAGPSNVVVLNSAKLSRELFEKRGAIYSGRPFDYIPREHIVRGAEHIVFLPHGNYLKKWRTAVRYLLGPSGCEQILPIQEAAAAFMSYRLVSEPKQFMDHTRNWSLATALFTISGHRGAQKDPQLAKTFFDNQENWLELLTPGVAPPVDMFPILKLMPESLGGGWKRQARKLHHNQKGFYYMMLDAAKEERKRATDPDNASPARHESLMAKMLRERQEVGKEGFDDHQLAYMGGGLLDAAVDTTFSSALTLIKALATYPEITRRAQEEVDGVCGSERPPQPRDLGQLPYLKACYLEALRWRPPAPANLPRRLEADDTVGGFVIPRGTTVLQNNWAIQNDPEYFDEPEAFRPERYLTNPYGTRLGATDAQMEGRKFIYTFGTGRRVCPGDLFAQNGTLMLLAKLVWAFDLAPPQPLDLSVETGYHGGLVLGSEAFDLDFVPRSETRRQAVLGDWEHARTVLE